MERTLWARAQTRPSKTTTTTATTGSARCSRGAGVQLARAAAAALVVQIVRPAQHALLIGVHPGAKQRVTAPEARGGAWQGPARGFKKARSRGCLRRGAAGAACSLRRARGAARAPGPAPDQQPAAWMGLRPCCGHSQGQQKRQRRCPWPPGPLHCCSGRRHGCRGVHGRRQRARGCCPPAHWPNCSQASAERSAEHRVVQAGLARTNQVQTVYSSIQTVPPGQGWGKALGSGPSAGVPRWPQ